MPTFLCSPLVLYVIDPTSKARMPLGKASSMNLPAQAGSYTLRAELDQGENPESVGAFCLNGLRYEKDASPVPGPDVHVAPMKRHGDGIGSPFCFYRLVNVYQRGHNVFRVDRNKADLNLIIGGRQWDAWWQFDLRVDTVAGDEPRVILQACLMAEFPRKRGGPLAALHAAEIKRRHVEP